MKVFIRALLNGSHQNTLRYREGRTLEEIQQRYCNSTCLYRDTVTVFVCGYENHSRITPGENYSKYVKQQEKLTLLLS